MLKKLDYPTQVESATVLSVLTPTISGCALSHWLTRLTPAERGIVGAELHIGARNLVKPTIDQAALLAHASATYVWTASKLSESQRSLVWRGLVPLMDAKPKRAVPAPVSDDEALTAIVARVGVDHALNVIASAEKLAA